MSFAGFLREKVTGVGILTTFGAFVGTVVGLDYLYETYWVSSASGCTEPFIWSASITLGFYVFFGLLNYCWYAQMIMQDEIDRVTKIKARLETQVLKKRRSSKKRR